MNTFQKVKPTVWFWIISIVALLWNLMGVIAYLMEAYMKDEVMAGYSEAQREIFASQPAWITGAFATAVFAGAIGCIALLLRKKWAGPVLMISLLAVLARTIYFFFMTDGTEVFDVVEGTVLPILTVVIAAGLVIFSRVSKDRLWIT
jgi:hypothetical protein